MKYSQAKELINNQISLLEILGFEVDSTYLPQTNTWTLKIYNR